MSREYCKSAGIWLRGIRRDCGVGVIGGLWTRDGVLKVLDGACGWPDARGGSLQQRQNFQDKHFNSALKIHVPGPYV